MEESKLFGDKRNFAIELAFTKAPKRYKLGFWTENRRLGNFKKGGELKYSIKQYYAFIKNKESFYLDVFDKLTAAEIFYYLVGVFFTKDGKKIPLTEHENRAKFYLFWDQFANQTGGWLLLYKNGKVTFVIKRPMDGPIDSYEFRFDYFCSVFDEYIEYCEVNGLA